MKDIFERNQRSKRTFTLNVIRSRSSIKGHFSARCDFAPILANEASWRFIKVIPFGHVFIAKNGFLIRLRINWNRSGRVKAFESRQHVTARVRHHFICASCGPHAAKLVSKATATNVWYANQNLRLWRHFNRGRKNDDDCDKFSPPLSLSSILHKQRIYFVEVLCFDVYGLYRRRCSHL